MCDAPSIERAAEPRRSAARSRLQLIFASSQHLRDGLGTEAVVDAKLFIHGAEGRWSTSGSFTPNIPFGKCPCGHDGDRANSLRKCGCSMIERDSTADSLRAPRAKRHSRKMRSRVNGPLRASGLLVGLDCPVSERSAAVMINLRSPKVSGANDPSCDP